MLLCVQMQLFIWKSALYEGNISRQAFLFWNKYIGLIENLQALFFEKEEGKLFFPLSRSFVTTLAAEQIENLQLLR